MLFPILITIVAGYLLGNLNGAVCTSRLMHDDVRNHGSGNAGLTNFIRNYGVGSAALVVLMDAGKAVVACLLGGYLLAPYGLQMEGMTLGGVSVMVGHDFPALLGFRGGKGVLSGFLIALTIDWRIGAVIFVVFFAAYFATRYVSLGSVLAAAAFAICFALFHHDQLYVMLGGIFMGALTIFMHRSNIVRLVKGQERRTNLFAKGTNT